MGNIIWIILIVSWVCAVYAKKRKPKGGASGSGGQQMPRNAQQSRPGSAGYARRAPGNAGSVQGRPGNTGSYQSRQMPVNTGSYQSRQTPVNTGSHQSAPGNGFAPRPAGNPNAGRGQYPSGSAAARQQQLKSRLQQKYGGRPMSAYSTQSMQKNRNSADNILERAKNNVRENEKDELRTGMAENRAGAADASAPGQIGADGVFSMERQIAPADDQGGFSLGLIPGESELIREINDLMATGYSGDMAFERDFIAEGIEMLNRFELPNS